MPKDPAEPQPSAAREGADSRPVDLGLSEGRSMAFAPTSALAPEGVPIGGLAPAKPQSGATGSGDSSGEGAPTPTENTPGSSDDA